MKNVLFKFDVDSGKNAGTGHFMRCLIIYNLLKKKYKNKFKYYFLFNNYHNSKNIVEKHINKKNLIIYKKNSFPKISFIQRDDLIFCLNQIFKSVSKGRAFYRIYRQFKMYNDPKMNPKRSQMASPHPIPSVSKSLLPGGKQIRKKHIFDKFL